MEIVRKIALVAVAAGICATAAGTAAADPAPAPLPAPIGLYPSGTLQGTTNVPGGDLIWKGKTFNSGTVYDNFAFPSPFPWIYGMISRDASGALVTDYSASGFSFLSDRITQRPDGTYEGILFLFGNPVAAFGLHQ